MDDEKKRKRKKRLDNSDPELKEALKKSLKEVYGD